jgi:hypothetical protein
MIDMALLSVLKRWHFRDGMLIREITRRTGLSLIPCVSIWPAVN